MGFIDWEGPVRITEVRPGVTVVSRAGEPAPHHLPALGAGQRPANGTPCGKCPHTIGEHAGGVLGHDYVLGGDDVA